MVEKNLAKSEVFNKNVPKEIIELPSETRGYGHVKSEEMAKFNAGCRQISEEAREGILQEIT
ncbi:MAG: hypothetical protein O3B03_02605 [Proteobacteria bacterium]|nr:hypothetical protein [Pseudomonadota bacterium]MDA1331450.1 hypothetical protein [Pseudomonadota bacterium]